MPASQASSTNDSTTSKVYSCDGAPPHPFALRYPAVTIKKDGPAKRDAVHSRDNAVKVIDYMLKNPGQTSKVYNFVEQLQKQDDQIDENEAWSSQYRRVWRIPAEWWCQFLAVNGGDNLPPTTVQGLYQRDERVVKQLGMFVCCISTSTKLPPILLNKQLAARVFAKLAQKHNRFERVGKAVDLETGTVTWSKCSPYKVHWGKDDCANKLEYLTGETIDLATCMRFPKSFKFRDPASDRDCCVTGPGDCTIALHKLFPLGQGPHKCMEPEDGSTLQAMGEEEERLLNEEQAAARAGQLECLVETTITPEKMAQKRAALVNAQKAMRAKRSKMEVDMEG